jgi:hypothetical protein
MCCCNHRCYPVICGSLLYMSVDGNTEIRCSETPGHRGPHQNLEAGLKPRPQADLRSLLHERRTLAQRASLYYLDKPTGSRQYRHNMVRIEEIDIIAGAMGIELDRNSGCE